MFQTESDFNHCVEKEFSKSELLNIIANDIKKDSTTFGDILEQYYDELLIGTNQTNPDSFYLGNSEILENITEIFKNADGEEIGEMYATVKPYTEIDSDTVYGKISIDKNKPWSGSSDNLVTGEIELMPDYTMSYTTYSYGEDSEIITEELSFEIKMTGIEPFGFSDLPELTKIKIADTYTDIGNCAFNNTPKLVEIESNQLGFDGKYVTNKTDNSINSVTKYNDDEKCGVLKIPENITELNDYAYANLNSMYKLDDNNNSVPQISDWSDYTIIHKVIIHKNLTKIGKNPFVNNGWLNEIEVDPENRHYKIDRNCLIEIETSRLITALPGFTIPNYIKIIGTNAFSNCKNEINGELIIPNSVKTIENNVFKDCNYLTSIIIPDSVEYIGINCFANCKKLISVILGNNVREIGNCAFYECRNLTSVTIGNSVTSIGSEAFYNCNALTSINIPDSVISIRRSAFYNCHALKSVTIGNNVTSIGNGAFSYCYALTSVTIGNSVTSIGKHAFYYCSSLASVTIGNSVTSIGEYAFHYCQKLTSVTIGNSVTSIGPHAFSSTALASVTIGNGVISIGSEAFQNCSKLKSVTIGNNVTSIGNNAFSSCYALTSITIDSDNTVYKSDGNCIIEKATNKLIVGCNNSVIPNYVTSIGNYAFYYCRSLTSINIPDSVTSIGNYAFYYCESLRSITIPDGVTSIGDNAFSDCEALTSIIIPDSVTSIGSYVFSSCSSLGVIKIGDGIKIIGTDNMYGLQSLSIIYIGKNVEKIETNGLGYSCPRLSKIVVDPENKHYKVDGDCLIEIATNTVIVGLDLSVIPDYIEHIADYAFYNRTKFYTKTLPTSLKTIGQRAFYGCTLLDELTIPDSVTTIRNYAFSNCTALVHMEIGNGIEIIDRWFNGNGLRSLVLNKKPTVSYPSTSTINTANNLLRVYYKAGSGFKSTDKFGNKAMKEWKDMYYTLSADGTYYIVGNPNANSASYACTATGYLEIPAEYNGLPVKEIAPYAFYQCQGLLRVILPDTIEKIGAYAFYECKGLVSFVFPTNPNFTTISEWSFAGSLIAAIYIPENVTTIKNHAFRYATSLQNVTIPKLVQTIEANAFQYCTGLRRMIFEGKPATIDSTIFANCNAAFTTVNFTPDSGWTTSDKIGGKTAVEMNLFSFELSSDKTYYIVNRNTALAVTAIFGQLRIPDTYNGLPVKEVKASAFSGATNITSIDLGNNVEIANASAFYNCYNTIRLDLRNLKTCIGANSFCALYNRQLNRIYIPATLTTIQTSTFGSNAYVDEYIVDPANPKYKSINSAIVNVSTKTLVRGANNTTIPTDASIVTTIGGYAFRASSRFMRGKILTLPSNIATLGGEAFNGCSGIVGFKLPKQLNTTSKFPATTIANMAGLLRLEVEEGNTGFFADQNCILRKNYTGKDSYTNRQFPNSWLHVGCKGSVIPDYTQMIGYQAFYCGYSSTLYEFRLPPSVEIIDSYAFYACQSWTSIEIPDNIVAMGTHTFMYCSGATSLKLPKHSVIKANAFRYMSKLTSIDIPDTVTQIDTYAFANNAALKEIVVGKNVKTIAAKAFDTNAALETMIFKPYNPPTIAADAITNTAKLTSITVLSNKYPATYGGKTTKVPKGFIQL